VSELIDPHDLIDAREAAAMLGYAHAETFHALVRRRSDVPRPVIDKGKGRSRLWSRTELIGWQAVND